MRKIIFIIFALFIGNSSFGQGGNNSPFSSYGIGESHGLDHATILGVGNCAISLVDSTILNFYNPASYSTIAKGQPLFSFGTSSRISIYNEGGVKETSPYTSIHHFAFGLSFAKRLGMAFGLQPYSRRGYDFSTGDFIGSDSITYTYQGTGSINKAFLGLSVDVLKFDSTSLSVGANLGYLFGNVSNTRKAVLFGSTQDGGVGVKTYDVRSFHYDLGVSFQHQFSPNHSIGAYATFDPLQNLNTSYEEGIFYASHVDNPNTYDTSSYFSSTDGTLTNVPKITYGLSYKYRFTDSKKIQRKLHPEIAVYASYSTSNWSKFENSYPSDTTTTFFNTSKLSFGVQFIPEAEFQLNTATTSFLARVRYRAGFYNYTLPYGTNGEQVGDFGTTFGFGIPVSVQKSLSSINLGFSIGSRGVTDQNQLRENYYGISLGITIAPGQAEKWFRKRKLN
ncbi:MAG: hypothetical protein HRT57_00790 [Crocinitomicaceae bacterium]|nr:hypothetical protein [Crocinitomicaceae bacterium]